MKGGGGGNQQSREALLGGSRETRKARRSLRQGSKKLDIFSARIKNNFEKATEPEKGESYSGLSSTEQASNQAGSVRGI